MTPDLAAQPSDSRAGFLRTTLSLLLLTAVLIGSWAVVIAVSLLVYRVFT